MRNQALLVATCILGAGIGIAACASSRSTSDTSGVSSARLVLANQASTPASLRVTATNQDSTEIALDQTVEVAPGATTVIEGTLAPASYTFAADLLGSGLTKSTIAVGSASATVASGSTTQIRVVAPNGTGRGAPLQVDAGPIPRITGVTVRGGQPSTRDITVTVAASSGPSSALTYFWSGAGLDGIVEGSSSITLPTSQITALAGPEGAAVLHVVAQDGSGVATSTDVQLELGPAGIGAAIDGSATDDVPSSCVASQAVCSAGCTLGIAPGWLGGPGPTSCLSTCGSSFAACVNNGS